MEYCIQHLKNINSNHFSIYFLRGLNFALAEFRPQLVIYNAGTDILEGDPLGYLSITPEVSITTSCLFISVEINVWFFFIYFLGCH